MDFGNEKNNFEKIFNIADKFGDLIVKPFDTIKDLFKNIKLNNSINILDVACGNGFNTKMLAYEIPNSKIYGIDINKNTIELANKYNLPLYLHERDAHDDFYDVLSIYKNKYPNFTSYTYL